MVDIKIENRINVVQLRHMDMSDIEKAEAANERAASRIPESGVESMNINSFIASLTDIGRSRIIPNSEVEESIEKSLDRTVGMFSYLRDNNGDQTVGDAMNSLAQRKVDEKVVKLWVEEGMAVNAMQFDAISKGYPEFKVDLERVRKETIDKILKRNP